MRQPNHQSAETLSHGLTARSLVSAQPWSTVHVACDASGRDVIHKQVHRHGAQVVAKWRAIADAFHPHVPELIFSDEATGTLVVERLAHQFDTSIHGRPSLLSAYAASILLLVVLVALTLWRGRRVRAEMNEIDPKAGRDG